MKSYAFKLLMAAVLIAGLTQCTEEIQVDLNNSDSVVVIEGLVSTNSDYSSVSLTRTKDFYASNDFNGIENAYVELSADDGHSDILEEYSAGKYKTHEILGEEGNTYNLIVVVNDTTYTSSCRIPSLVRMDSIFMRKELAESIFSSANDTVYNFYLYYNDPVDEDNYYQFLAYKNGEQVYSSVESDLTNDGLTVEQTISFTDKNSADDEDDEDEILEPGDSVTVEMRCISEDVYNYLYQLESSSWAATPTNPESNIDGAILGYFSAHTSEKRLFVVTY